MPGSDGSSSWLESLCKRPVFDGYFSLKSAPDAVEGFYLLNSPPLND